MTERYRALLVIKNGDRLTVFLKLPDENHSDFAQEGFALYAVISKKREAGSYLTTYLVGFLGVSGESVRLMHQPISLKG